MRRLFLLLIALPLLLAAQIPGEQKESVLLPNGWKLTPAGTQLPLGDFPMNAVLLEGEKRLVVSLSGQSGAALMLVDIPNRKVLDTIKLKDTWWGLRALGTTVYASGGNQNCIYVLGVEQDKFARRDTIQFEPAGWKHRGTAAGLDVTKEKAAVGFRTDSTLRTYDFKTKTFGKIRLEGMPYDCKFSGDLTLVTLWGSRKLVAYRGAEKKFEIRVGEHPNEITLSRDGRYAFVSCANDNTVSVIDLKNKRMIASTVTAVHPDAPEGSTTNSSAVSKDGQWLYAANADNNTLSVISIAKPGTPVPRGFIPTGWYPTKVLTLSDKSLIVVNGKGSRSFPNPKRQYIASLMVGSLSFIRNPSHHQLMVYTRAAVGNTPYRYGQERAAGFKGESAVPKTVGKKGPIKYVLYIIKENRTYDQVFGDMPQGNGDSSLTLFGEQVTPNQHALARRFGLMDNFYVNAEVSADGHNWSMAGYATDYIEKVWPTMYGGRGGEYDFEGDEPTGRPKSGYIWDACARRKVSYRSYGEFITAGPKVGDLGTPRVPSLVGHFAPGYRGWDMEYSDVERYKAWEEELTMYEKKGGLPNFCVMHLPNNHTEGTRKGALTPRAYVAQNDYALGLIIDRLSRSPYWKEMAVFVLEDDAQNGPDHIDAHRSPVLVISPYCKPNHVDHTLFTTASVLRTMELILGLPPMSQYDAAATPMFGVLGTKPDFAPYKVLEPTWNINERNAKGDYGQDMLEGVDFSREDAVPDLMFSEIIWRSIKGTEMPAPKYTIFSIGADGREDEDEDDE